MKRMHVHVSVSDLGKSIRFYSELFDAQPSVVEADYAKWKLDDPRVNFAISARGAEPGLDHLGIQVDSGGELQAIHDRLDAAGQAMLTQEATHCCYARSDKHWVTDPQGLAWETFHTLGSARSSHGQEHYERLVLVYRQFGSQHHRREHSQSHGEGPIPWLQCRQFPER
jgi:catechol 2,3-dioxygenase-like lactoylglutathione lyase family enzyme